MDAEILPPAREEVTGSAPITQEDAAEIRRLLARLAQDMPRSSKATTGSIRSTRQKRFRVAVEQIRQIDLKIRNQIERHFVEKLDFICSITYSRGEVVSMPSIDALAMHDTSQSEYIKEIAIEWTVSLSHQKCVEAQEYTIEIRMRSVVDRFERHLAALNDEDPASCYYRIVYHDYVIARNIASTIDDWFEGLPEVDAPWHFSYLHKENVIISIRRGLLLLSHIMAAIAASILMPLFSPEPTVEADLLEGLGGWILIAFLLLMTLSYITLTASDLVEKHVLKTEFVSAIAITNGDIERLEKRRSRNRRALLRALSVITSLIAAYLVSIFAAFTFEAWWR